MKSTMWTTTILKSLFIIFSSTKDHYHHLQPTFEIGKGPDTLQKCEKLKLRGRDMNKTTQNLNHFMGLRVTFQQCKMHQNH